MRCVGIGRAGMAARSRGCARPGILGFWIINASGATTRRSGNAGARRPALLQSRSQESFTLASTWPSRSSARTASA